jgi:hypothetical protein
MCILVSVSFRPVLLSEMSPYWKNNKELVTKEKIRMKSDHERATRFQDELVD